VLAKQIGNAIARGGSLNAGYELAAQLNSDRAREYPAGEDDQAACGVIPDFGIGVGDGMVEHRHAEQFSRRNKAGEGREPEIEAQRRENNKDEVAQRRHEAERLNRSHVFDVQG
jgi:hypothetical protein